MWKWRTAKGPLLVWIYYAAAWIDGHSFAGIFLIQCVTLFTTLLLACGTARFYLSQRGSLLASMLLCLFLFDSFPFQRGGGVEELCWPGMAAVVYRLVGISGCGTGAACCFCSARPGYLPGQPP